MVKNKMNKKIKRKYQFFNKTAFIVALFSVLSFAMFFLSQVAYAEDVGLEALSKISEVDISSKEESDSIHDTMGLKGASEAFADALLHGKSSVDVSEYNIPKEKAGFLLQYSQSENPDIFWYPESISYSFFEEDGFVSELSWENIYTDFSEILQMKSELDERLFYATNLCFNREMSDLDKVISAHDYLTEITEYKMTDDLSFTAYSVFVRNEGVCQGYSYAFKYLMDYVGIECYCVSSSTLNHGWNIIKLDGEYYHVDVTTDDPVPTYNDAKINVGRETHEKLLCSDAALNCGADDLILWGEIPLPDCKSTKYDNAFFKNVVGTMEFLCGKWYYVEPNEYINGSRRVLKTDGENVLVFMNMNDPVYSIASHGGFLYCSVKDTVYKVSVSGKAEVFCSTVGEIFGLRVIDNNLHYGVYRKDSYAICSKALPLVTDCIEGISMSMDSQNFFVNVFVKSYKGNEEGFLKYTIGDKETQISRKDFPADGVISIPVSIDLFESDIVMTFFCGDEKTVYRTSVKGYADSIINGDFSEDDKNVVRAMLLYGGIGDEDVPDNAFDEYDNVVSDGSDEISYVKTEVIFDGGVVAKVHFSVLGNAEFKSNRDAKIEKDGLYYVVTLKPFSVYEMDKTVTVSSKNINIEFCMLGIAGELDEASQKRIYFAHEYGEALNDYRNKHSEMNK